jgi:hypothetical protein
VATAPVTIATPVDWANAELGVLGVPDTQQNVADLLAWFAHEGGAGPEFGGDNTASYNPLNTTLKYGGSSTVASGPAAEAGVQSYTSWTNGLLATASTIRESQYSAIFNDLVAGNTPVAQFGAAVGKSPWGTPAFSSGGSGAAVEPSLFTAGGNANVSGSGTLIVGPTGGSAAGGANAESDLLPGNPNATSIAGLFGSLGGLEGFVFDVVFVLMGLVMILAGIYVLAKASGHDVTGKGSSSQSSSGHKGAEGEAAEALAA